MIFSELSCKEMSTEDKLPVEKFKEYLNELPGWEEKEGCLVKKYTFSNFQEALDFVNRIGKLAEKENHHPDLSLGWGYVDISLTTHSAGGITVNDFVLSTKIEDL